MTEQLLNAADISAIGQKVRSEGMAQAVNTSVLMDTSGSDGSLEGLLDGRG